MKKKILLTIFLGLLFLGSLGMPKVFAFRDPLGPGRWWQRTLVKDRLQLTSDQIEKINTIWTSYRKKIIDIDSLIKKGILDLENLLTQSEIGRQEAYKIADNIGRLHARHRTEQIKMAIDIRQELSQEQFQMLEEIKMELIQKIRKKSIIEHKRQEKLED